MSAISAEATEDPIGVIVGLVADRDPSLDRAVMVKVAEEVGGGRPKRAGWPRRCRTGLG